MHWSIQATVLILCIVTCAAQGRGSRRFSASSTSPSSVKEVITEEDVVVNNHRFQTRHGIPTETRDSEVSSGRERPSSRLQNRQETVSEVASTSRRSSLASRGGGDNEIIRTTSRLQSRQRIEPTTTTSRQYLSRNSRLNDGNIRRRIDVDITTEEIVTRSSVRTRNEKIRQSYNGRGTATTTQEQNNTSITGTTTTTAAQYRGRHSSTRDKITQQERPTSQIRSRGNGNIRQNDSNQSRAGRGRSLALEEPTTQSLRTRGRGIEKAIINEGKTTSTRFSDTRSGSNGRYNEPTRIVNNNRVNDQKSVDNIVTTSRGSRSRIGGRGRTNLRTEPSLPPSAVPVVETTSTTKIIEDVPISSSEIPPLDSFSQDQVMNVDVTQALELPLMQLLEDVSSEEIPLESSSRKLNGNGITSESNFAITEDRERLREITTAKLNTERSTRNPARGRGRKASSGRNFEGRNDNIVSSIDTNLETVTRNSRRNSQRFTSRPVTVTTRSTVVERPSISSVQHHGGRGRTREFTSRIVESTRNNRSEIDVTTINYRSRNNLFNQNNPVIGTTIREPSLDDHTLNYENNNPPPALPLETTIENNIKKVNSDLLSAVESDINKTALSTEPDLQTNNNNPTGSGIITNKQTITSDRQINNTFRGKLGGRGSTRASKTEALAIKKKDRNDEVSDDDNYPEVYKQLKKSGTDSKDILALLKAKKKMREALQNTKNNFLEVTPSSGTQHTDKIEKPNEDRQFENIGSTTTISNSFTKPNFRVNLRKNLFLNRKQQEFTTSSSTSTASSTRITTITIEKENLDDNNKNIVTDSKNGERSEESGKDSSDLSGRRSNFRNRYRNAYADNLRENTKKTQGHGLFNRNKDNEKIENEKLIDEQQNKFEKESNNNQRRFNPSSRFKTRPFNLQTTERIIQEIIQRNTRFNARDEGNLNKRKNVEVEQQQQQQQPSQIEKNVRETLYNSRRQFPSRNKDKYIKKFSSKEVGENLETEESDRSKENIYTTSTTTTTTTTEQNFKENYRYSRYNDRKLKFGVDNRYKLYNNRNNVEKKAQTIDEDTVENTKGETKERTTTPMIINRAKSDINGLLDKLERLALTERITSEKLDKPVYAPRNRLKEFEKFKARTEKQEQVKIESNIPINKSRYVLYDNKKNEIIYNNNKPSTEPIDEDKIEETVTEKLYKNNLNTRGKMTYIPYVPSIRNFIKSSTTPLPINRFKARKVSLEKLIGDNEDLAGDTSENHGLTIVKDEDDTNLIPNVNGLSVDSLVSESEISFISTEADEYTKRKSKRPIYQHTHIQRVPLKKKGLNLEYTTTMSTITPTITTTLPQDYESTIPPSLSTSGNEEENTERYITSDKPFLTNEVLLIVPTTFPETKISPTTRPSSTIPLSTQNNPAVVTTLPAIVTTLPSSTAAPATTTIPTTTVTTTTTTTTTPSTTTKTRTTTKPRTTRVTTTKPITTKITTTKLTTTKSPTTTAKKHTTVTTTPTTTTPTTTTPTTKSTTKTTTPKKPITKATTKPTTKKPATTTIKTSTTSKPIKKRTTTSAAPIKPITVASSTQPTSTIQTVEITAPSTNKNMNQSSFKIEQPSTQRIVTILSTLAVLVQNFTTPSPNQYGELNTADVRALIEETITRSTTPTTPVKPILKPSVTSDYQVYGLLPNNNLVRKRTTEAPLDIPFIIYGLYPNGTIVRRYPNGTIIPDEIIQEENEVVASIEPGNRESLENIVKKDNPLSYLYPGLYTSITPSSFSDYSQKPFASSTPFRIDLQLNIAKDTVIQKVNTPKFTSLPILTTTLLEMPTTVSTVPITSTNATTSTTISSTTNLPSTTKITTTVPTTVKTTKKPQSTTKPTQKPTKVTTKFTTSKMTTPKVTYASTTVKTTQLPNTTVNSNATKTTQRQRKNMKALDNVHTTNTTQSNVLPANLTITTTKSIQQTTTKPKINRTTKSTTVKPKSIPSPLTKTTPKSINHSTTKKPTTRQTTTSRTTSKATTSIRASSKQPQNVSGTTTTAKISLNGTTTTSRTGKSKGQSISNRILTTTTAATSTSTAKSKTTIRNTTSKPTQSNKSKKKATIVTTTTVIAVKTTEGLPDKTKVTPQDLADLEALSKVLDSEENSLNPDISKQPGANLAKEVIQLAIERAQKLTTTKPSKISLKDDLQTLSSTNIPVITEASAQSTSDITKSKKNRNGKISLWVLPEEEKESLSTERPVQTSASSNEVDILNVLLSTPTSLENLSPKEQLLLADVISTTTIPKSTKKKKKKKPKTTTTTTPVPAPAFPILRALFGQIRGGGGLFQNGGWFQRWRGRNEQAITTGNGGIGSTSYRGLFRPAIPATTSTGTKTEGSDAAFGTFGAESVNDDVVNNANTAIFSLQDSTENPRNGLVGAAINVSRAVSQFMGYVIQGATQSFQNYLQTRTRALAQALAYPPATS